MDEITTEFTKSVDEKTFRDFKIDGTEKDFRQQQLITAGRAYTGGVENSNNNALETFSDGIELITRQNKDIKEKLRKFNGVSYTDADLEDTIKAILEDKEAFAEQYDLSSDEADRAEYYAFILDGMTPEERDIYLKDLEKTDPRVARAYADHLKQVHATRAQEFVHEGSASTSLKADEVAEELDSSRAFRILCQPKLLNI